MRRTVERDATDGVGMAIEATPIHDINQTRTKMNEKKNEINSELCQIAMTLT